MTAPKLMDERGGGVDRNKKNANEREMQRDRETEIDKECKRKKGREHHA